MTLEQSIQHYEERLPIQEIERAGLKALEKESDEESLRSSIIYARYLVDAYNETLNQVRSGK